MGAGHGSETASLGGSAHFGPASYQVAGAPHEVKRNPLNRACTRCHKVALNTVPGKVAGARYTEPDGDY